MKHRSCVSYDDAEMLELITQTEIVLLLCGATLFPAMFYLGLKIQLMFFRHLLTEADIYTIGMRVVSSIQAITACVVGYIIVINTQNDVIYSSHWLTEAYSWFGLPYFYYDVWAMYQAYWYKYERIQQMSSSKAVYTFMSSQPLMMFHHLIFPFFYFPLIVYFRHGLGDFFVGCFFLIELAVPFISFRAILLQLGQENTIVYKVNGVIVIVTFLVCRILIIPFMYWRYGEYIDSPIWKVPFLIPIKCTVGCLAILWMQVYWWIQMIRICRRTLKKNRVNQMGGTQSKVASYKTS